MKRLNDDALLALIGLIIVLVFSLGIIVGATIHAGISKQLSVDRAAVAEAKR